MLIQIEKKPSVSMVYLIISQRCNGQNYHTVTLFYSVTDGGIGIHRAP